MRIFLQKTANEDWWQLCKWLRTLIISDTTQRVNLWINVTGKVALVHNMKATRGGKAPLILNFITQLLELSLASQSLYSSPQKESPVSIKQKSTWAPRSCLDIFEEGKILLSLLRFEHRWSSTLVYSLYWLCHHSLNQFWAEREKWELLYRGAVKSLARPGRKEAQNHVRDMRDFSNNIETRAVIKFLFSCKAPKEIHAIQTETLASFIPGRAKDLSAPPVLLQFLTLYMKYFFQMSSTSVATTANCSTAVKQS